MAGKTIYIHPNSEDYTGYSTFVFSVPSTAFIQDFTSQGEVKSPGLFADGIEEQNDDVLPTEIIEENIIDEDLARFYRGKGYKF